MEILWQSIVAQALHEDLGRRGDVTTQALVASRLFPDHIQAVIRARQSGCIAGVLAVQLAFKLIDPEVQVTFLKQDGDAVETGEAVAYCRGAPASILAAERVALNFLGHLSGIATQTQKYVTLAVGTRARICATRKTTPGLRAMEKAAVQSGGGLPHRFGLDDAILIKDNHIQLAGGITAALEAARRHNGGHTLMIQIEIDTFAQLEEAMALQVPAVLLDNMSVPLLADCVAYIRTRAISEASGGVNMDNIQAIAQTGVDLISCGALTHSAPCLDVGLDIESRASLEPI